jgi:hypothetical protein
MRHVITVSFCVAVGVTMLVAVFLQQNRIARLRAEQTQVLARLADPAEMPLADAPANPQDVKQSSHSPAIELLQLRAEVTRLGNRKRELGGALVANQRLQAQFATRGTNVPGAVALPAGYIGKSQARKLGYATPEATFETMLWAIQNRDASSFLQVYDPKRAKQLEAEMQSPSSTNEFFKRFDSMQGMSIVGKEAGRNGGVYLLVQTVPDETPPARLPFRQFGDQWKFDTGL